MNQCHGEAHVETQPQKAKHAKSMEAHGKHGLHSTGAKVKEGHIQRNVPRGKEDAIEVPTKVLVGGAQEPVEGRVQMTRADVGTPPHCVPTKKQYGCCNEELQRAFRGFVTVSEA